MIWNLLFLTSVVSAGPVPFPSLFPSARDFASEFRSTVRIKLTEMNQNYSTDYSGRSVVFTDVSSTQNCKSGAKVPKGTALTRVDQAFKEDDEGLSEVVTLTGCRGKVLLTETVRTTGKDLIPVSFALVAKGERPLELLPNETSKLYTLKDEDGVEFFRWFIKRSDGKEFLSVTVTGQDVLSVWWAPGEERSTIRAVVKSYDIRYSRFSQSLRSRMRFSAGAMDFTVDAQKSGEVGWYKSQNATKPSTFKAYFDEMVIGGIFGATSWILKILGRDLPTTEFLSSGTQNSRILDELNLALNRLQTKTDLKLVEQLILGYLDAIQAGLLKIQDNRTRND